MQRPAQVRVLLDLGKVGDVGISPIMMLTGGVDAADGKSMLVGLPDGAGGDGGAAGAETEAVMACAGDDATVPPPLHAKA